MFIQVYVSIYIYMYVYIYIVFERYIKGLRDLSGGKWAYPGWQFLSHFHQFSHSLRSVSPPSPLLVFTAFLHKTCASGAISSSLPDLPELWIKSSCQFYQSATSLSCSVCISGPTWCWHLRTIYEHIWTMACSPVIGCMLQRPGTIGTWLQGLPMVSWRIFLVTRGMWGLEWLSKKVSGPAGVRAPACRSHLQQQQCSAARSTATEPTAWLQLYPSLGRLEGNPYLRPTHRLSNAIDGDCA